MFDETLVAGMYFNMEVMYGLDTLYMRVGFVRKIFQAELSVLFLWWHQIALECENFSKQM